jgi:putative hydrolase of the HAD superfamily
LQTLNVKPQNVVYVADNPAKDFIAPNKMGILTIQIIRPARIHTESAAEAVAAAKYVIHQLTRLPPLLDRL